MAEKATATLEAPPAEAQADSLAIPLDLEAPPEAASEGVAVEEASPETVAETPAETPEALRAIIRGLSQDAKEAVAEELWSDKGPESEYLKERVRRERQSEADIRSRQEKEAREVQQEQLHQLEQAQAWGTEKDSFIRDTKAAFESGDGTLDEARLNRVIMGFGGSLVGRQAVIFNQELQKGAVEVIEQYVGPLQDEDRERINDAIREGNKQRSRQPMIKALLETLLEGTAAQLYQLALQDVNTKLGRDNAVVAQKEALLRLKSAVPWQMPPSVTSQSSGSDQDRLDRLAGGKATETDRKWYFDKYGKYLT